MNAAVIAAVTAVLFFILECFNRASLIDVLTWGFSSPIAWLTNFLIIFVSLMPALFLKRRLPVLVLITALWLTIGVGNGVVLSYRAAPLSAIDLLVIKSMFGMAPVYFSVFELVLIIAGAVSLIFVLVLLFIRCPKFAVFYKKAVAVFLAAALILLVFCCAFPAAHSYGADKLALAYKDYGFAYCFSHSLFSRGVERPEGFESADVDKIIGDIDSDSTEAVNIPVTDANVIIVQLESFFDVNSVRNIAFSENPLPNFTKLKEEGISGYLRVPHLGGGTSNVEFEVLTGMSLDHFGFGEYPYTTSLKTQACESLAFNLGELGYASHAMHNHIATFYDRNLAYAGLGFDTFTPIEMMSGIERNALGWAKDEVLIGEIESALDSTESLDFVFAVSVQGHGKYPEEPIDEVSSDFALPPDGVVEPEIQVYNIADSIVHSKFTYYVNELKEVDRFISDLTDMLSERGEPCAVVFYGDHLPSLPISERDLVNGDMYLTEYAVWSNVPLGGLEDGADANSLDRDLDTTELAAYIQHLLGISVGDVAKLRQRELATGEDLEGDIHTLQYAQFSDDTVTEYTPAAMTFGTRPITVDSMSKRGSTVTVHGSGFNEYSVVNIGGFDRNTHFVDEHTLTVDNVIFDITELSVVQQTVDGTALYTAVYDFDQVR